jgi:hypothetical protein
LTNYTAEQWTARKAEQKANRRGGKFAEQNKSMLRLTGRVKTAKELERDQRKQLKKQQKRMELLTKSHYPTPKRGKYSTRMF